MHTLAAYRNVARVTKTQGLTGEVVAVPTAGLPFLLSAGMVVNLTPPPLRGIRVAKIEEVRPLAKGWGVRFEGVDDIGTASGLIGRMCLVRVDDLPSYEVEDEWDGCIGYEVFDRRYGLLGIVVELLETKAHDVWVIEGPFGEVMLPVVDEFIEEIESPAGGVAGGRVNVCAPDGLIELHGKGRG